MPAVKLMLAYNQFYCFQCNREKNASWTCIKRDRSINETSWHLCLLKYLFDEHEKEKKRKGRENSLKSEKGSQRVNKCKKVNKILTFRYEHQQPATS